MTGDLQFDRVEPTGPAETTVCAACRRAIVDVYYTARTSRVCGDCKSAYEQHLGSTPESTRFIRAVFFGFGAAVVGTGINYLVLIRMNPGWGGGLVALLVGYLIGVSVRKGSGGRGGWRYQTLAMALTYLSIIGMFIPQIVQGGLPAIVYLRLLVGPFLGKIDLFLLFVIGIALYEAWQLNRCRTIDFKGPYQIGIAPGKQASG